jgi:dihydroorotate dehydrogenase electron transfer subunit
VKAESSKPSGGAACNTLNDAAAVKAESSKPSGGAACNTMRTPAMTLLHAPLEVLENVPLARHTYRIRLLGPDLAAAIRPGQFVMLRLPSTTDPLLGRPFALYDTVLEAGRPVALDVVYLVVGKMTGKLASVKPGDRIETWGPLGNGFVSLEGADHVGLVAGGIGQTPFLAHIRQLLGTRGYGGRPARREAQRVTLYYGVRTADLAAGVEDFRAAGAEVLLASDDGSLGERGFVTEMLERHGPPEHLFGCGPEPMLHALAALARRWGTPCHVSLETPMACGVGVCFSCVTRVKTDQGWDYRRVCVEGPVFDASRIEW